ncbi:MAG: ABC transporter substrate-binding protein [Promethearchaeota archaeon]
MESATKRILAIVLIVVIGVGIGIGAFIFLSAPESEIKYPGAPSGFDKDNTILIGCAGDTGEIQGDANYEGAWFACKAINEAGGVVINSTTYYFGVTKEDTDESNTNLVTARGIDAARRLIYDKEVDFGIGGFRSEALLAYVEEFMDAEVIFIDTGAATDVFCTNVLTDYPNYKWFFRFMPINSTSLGGQILGTLAGFILTMNATYPNHDVKEIGVLAEDLTWVTSLVAAITGYLPALTGGWASMLTPILYDITLSATDMNTHLASFQSDGADIVIPVISAQGGILMMQQYALNNYDYLIFGIDVQSQLDTFWKDTGGDCVYETIMQTLYKTNKTTTSIAFWDAFIDEFKHEPLYIACGAYDAVMAIKDAVFATQSLRDNDIIQHMETWTTSNPHPGVSGGGAWWPKSHDLVAGFPYGYTLWCQWQTDGTKNVIPASIYAPWVSTGPYVVAPWVNTAWS